VKVFSEVRSLKDTVVKGNTMRRPSVNIGRSVVSPSSVELRQNSGQPVLTGISGGHELIGKGGPSGLASPDIKVRANAEKAMQEFLDSVRRDIESKKKYPVVARDAGLEGRSGVKMTILKDGQLEKVVLVDSSGHEILDKAALQSVRDAAPFPPIPMQIGRDRVEMNIYLVFKIT
jgi:protein TonB